MEKFTLDYVFSRVDSAGIQAKRFLNDIYLEHLYDGNNRVGGDYLDAASDDAISIDSSDPDVYKLLLGRYSAVTRVADMEWGEFYTGIRKANIVINNIDIVPFNLKYINALSKRISRKLYVITQNIHIISNQGNTAITFHQFKIKMSSQKACFSFHTKI